MALNIKNAEVAPLAAEVAQLAGQTKTEAIKQALAEKRERLLNESDHVQRIERFFHWLETEFWPTLPPGVRKKGISKEEGEEILGFGPEGF